MWKIKKSLFESIKTASKSVYPNEFISLLGGKEDQKIVEELVVLPATFGEDFSSIRLDLMPFDSTIIGSIHSHPSYINLPSNADLNLFSRLGVIHIIIAFPFTDNSFRVMNAKGTELKYELI